MTTLHSEILCTEDDCTEVAAEMVQDRETRQVKALCTAHAALAVARIDRDAEYTEHCPHCGCIFGVN